jgi:hypothetical protein
VVLLNYIVQILAASVSNPAETPRVDRSDCR